MEYKEFKEIINQLESWKNDYLRLSVQKDHVKFKQYFTGKSVACQEIIEFLKNNYKPMYVNTHEEFEEFFNLIEKN